MSEEDKNNNTSGVDQVAVAIAATNDDVSSSLNDTVFGSAGSSSVNGGSLGSAGSSSLADSLTSAGSLGSDGSALVSAYSSGVMSALDQTYYGGSLQKASPFAAITPTATPIYATQNKNTYIIDTSQRASVSDVMNNAAQSGHATLFYDTGNASVTGAWVVGGHGTGLGNVVFSQRGGLTVQDTGAANLSVAQGAQVWVGSSVALGFSSKYAINLASSSYLSAGGYIGGVADKSQAGTSLGAGAQGLRTAGISTADDVGLEVGADIGLIGDYRRNQDVPRTVFGNNNLIVAHGNLGVFMNASMTVGSNTTMSIGKGGADGGSGFFIGSGGYFSGGIGNTYNVTGGMGAAYNNNTLNTTARMYFGDNTSVVLNQANWGNFAAQAGGDIRTGDNFYLRGLELSVGFAQDPDTGAPTGTLPASITIGNNATISLGQSGLYDNGYNFYLGSNGDIVLDGSANILTIGTGASINGNNISLGNFAKDYLGSNPQTNSMMSFSWYTTGNNNTVTIGAGATLNLSGGIALDGNNNNLTLSGGGTTGNVINAGYISAGRFYKEYQTAVSGSRYVFDNTSNTNLTIGDGYTITLTAGTMDTGLSNEPTISNNGNLEARTSGVLFNLGNNVTLNANSMVVGDYSLSTTNKYTNAVFSVNSATGGSYIHYGADAQVNLSGAVLLNGSSNQITFGDRLTLNAETASFGIGAAGGVQTNNTFSTGLSAHLTFNNGFTDNLSNGVVQFGDASYLHILAGDLAIGASGGGTDRSWFHMGANNSITLDNGSIVMTGSQQTMDWGVNGIVSANGLTVSGPGIAYYMNTGATVNIAGALEFGGSASQMTFESGLTLNAGTITLRGVGTDAETQTNNTFTIGSNANITLNNGFNNNLYNGVTTFGDNVSTHILAGNWTLAGSGLATAPTSNGTFLGNNNTITLDSGSIVMNNSTQIMQWGTSGTVNANNLNLSGYRMGYIMGDGANVNLTGAFTVDGINHFIQFDNDLTLNAGSVALGGALTTDTARVDTQFSIGNNANVTVNSGFSNYLYNGVVQFGIGANVHLLAGDFLVAGSGINGNRTWTHMGDSNTLTLDSGSIVMANGAQTMDWGINGIVSANSLNISGNDQTFTMGTSANVALTGGILVDATSANLTFGDNTALNIGSNGITFNNNSANFQAGANGSVSVNGDITFAANATNAIFNIGAGQTLFKANNININANDTALTFGGTTNYDILGWNLTAANNNVVLGDGATGSLGNITVTGAATGALFNTGNANNLTFGDASFAGAGNTFTINGTVTGNSLSLTDTTTLNVVAGANVDITSLALDGTQQVTINVGSGATLNIGSLVTTNVGSTNIPKIVINGGTVIIDGQKVRSLGLDAHEADFNGVDNGIYQYKGSIQEASGNLTVTNFALTDQLIFNLDTTARLDQNRYRTSYADGVLTISYLNPDGTTTEVARFNYTPADPEGDLPNVLIVADAGSSTGYDIIITKCFLAGTHILTPKGEVVVENLKAGDEVITLQDGQPVSKRVVWAGNMDVNVHNYEQKDTLYPVRIKAHAFGLNQPCRDLLVTPEHTIYVDGGLIPARMLVNGRSIIVDKTVDQFTVYHIETEEHSILLSENLATESYLNTDDRYLFNGDAVNLHLTFNENAGHQSWENDAVAPLTVARHHVEPIWKRLNYRATRQGYAVLSKPETTHDPKLCLITQKGEKIQPVDINGNTYSFYVPANIRVVAMHSKSSLPSEVVGPFLDDRRMLGVLVAKISVFSDKTFDILPADMAGLSGWHSADLDRQDRWTKGLATLPESVSEVSSKVKLIKIELTATSEYFVDTIEFVEKIA